MALKALKGYMKYRHERLGRPDKYMIIVLIFKYETES